MDSGGFVEHNLARWLELDAGKPEEEEEAAGTEAEG